MRIVFATMAIIFVGLLACRTTKSNSPSSEKDATDDATLIVNVKTALKEGGCLGCHADTDEGDWKEWAAKTTDTYERLSAEEKVGFDPTTFTATGVYLSYPEYFQQYFSEADKFSDFAQNYRPDPGMRVKGSGDDQKNAFIKIRDAMIELTAKVAP